MNYKGVGLANVGSYQVSGRPYLTGSTINANGGSHGKVHKVVFPRVAKAFTVINSTSIATSNSGDIRVHFGSGSTEVTNACDSYVIKTTDDIITAYHYVTVKDQGSVTMNVKCKEVYISNWANATAAYEVVAELTHILTSSMYHLTGSGITAIVGTSEAIV